MSGSRTNWATGVRWVLTTARVRWATAGPRILRGRNQLHRPRSGHRRARDDPGAGGRLRRGVRCGRGLRNAPPSAPVPPCRDASARCRRDEPPCRAPRRSSGARSADASDRDVAGLGEIGKNGVRKCREIRSRPRSARFRLRPFQPDEGRTETLQARCVLVAARLVDLPLAAHSVSSGSIERQFDCTNSRRTPRRPPD